MLRVLASYRLRTETAQEAGRMARLLAHEQTVELPPDFPLDELVRERVLGQVLSVEQTERGFVVQLGYPVDESVFSLPFLLNLVFGNASLFPGVRLIDLALPDELSRAIGGPLLGAAGLRARTGVTGRPLLATALKPRGSSLQHLSRMAEAFARGGGDLVKDDQNLVSASIDDFRLRVGACAEAVARGNARAGTNCLYFPHVSGAEGVLLQQIEFVRSLGLVGVLACPMVLGIEHLRGLLRAQGLALMAHPAWAGSHLLGEDSGVDHGVLLGTLFRLGGADISIFPNAGGRFSFGKEDCRRIVLRLREPMADLPASLPAPAGGMQLGSIARLCEDYGSEAIFLIGGALLGHSTNLQASTEAFRRAIHDAVAGPRC